MCVVKELDLKKLESSVATLRKRLEKHFNSNDDKVYKIFIYTHYYFKIQLLYKTQFFYRHYSLFLNFGIVLKLKR